MNCDYSKNPPDLHTQKLQFLSSIYQLQQLISEPTCVTNMFATLIDLIFTNESHNISKSGVIHIGLSDHNLIYAVRKFIPNKRGRIKKEVRNLKHFVKEDFIYDLLNIPWEMVETINDPNLAWRVWETNFNEVLNWHAPLRHRRVRQSSIPWLNSNIKNLMRKRDYHKKQSVKYNSEHHWRLYQSFRNNVNIQLRKSKSHYYRQKIGECKKNDPKTTWTLINTLIGRSSGSKHINEVKVDNETFRDDESISEAFNEFFINIGPKSASEVRNPSINKIETFLEDHAVTIPSFHFSTIPVENVLNTLRHLNASKGTGLDKIPARMLRIAADIIAPSLTYIFNLSISDWSVC